MNRKEILRYLFENAPINSASSGNVLGLDIPSIFVGIEKRKKKDKKNKKNRKSMRSFKDFFEEYNLTFVEHDTLNPKLWNNDEELKPEVKEKMINNAHAWISFAHINPDMVKDILFTGGNANYLYNDLSDIDIHVLVDYSQLFDHDVDMNKDYFNDKKELWKVKYPDLNIAGYPIEMYAQDISEVPHLDQGVYSLMFDKWVLKPVKQDLDNDLNMEKDSVQSIADQYQHKIEELISNNYGADNAENLKLEIHNLRDNSIAKDGEFGEGNLVFKELRNRGLIDKLKAYKNSILYNQIMK